MILWVILSTYRIFGKEHIYYRLLIVMFSWPSFQIMCCCFSTGILPWISGGCSECRGWVHLPSVPVSFGCCLCFLLFVFSTVWVCLLFLDVVPDLVLQSMLLVSGVELYCFLVFTSTLQMYLWLWKMCLIIRGSLLGPDLMWVWYPDAFRLLM